MSESQQIKHDIDESVFTLLVDDKRAARMTYSVVSDNEITLDYMEVFPQFRRRGFAKILVDKIAHFAREERLKITPICGVAGGILRSNPQYADVL